MPAIRDRLHLHRHPTNNSPPIHNPRGSRQRLVPIPTPRIRTTTNLHRPSLPQSHSKLLPSNPNRRQPIPNVPHRPNPGHQRHGHSPPPARNLHRPTNRHRRLGTPNFSQRLNFRRRQPRHRHPVKTSKLRPMGRNLRRRKLLLQLALRLFARSDKQFRLTYVNSAIIQASFNRQ
jgi:hypothetical protein